MQSNEILCSDCLTIQDQHNFYCTKCNSTRLLSYSYLKKLTIAHIDCDAFYAAIEKRDNPLLKHKPIIVADSAKSVVSTACYIARGFGIHSAMPVGKALRLCPEVIMVKPNIQKYENISAELASLLLELTPLVEQASIDEFFLDLTGTQNLHKRLPILKLLEYQNKIYSQFTLSVSVGLSYCKFLAKLASDIKKPSGFFIIDKREAKELIASLPINRVHGVGKQLEKQLKEEQIYTIRDLQKVSKIDFIAKYKTIGSRLYNFAQAQDNRPVEPTKTIKSISKETSFYAPLSGISQIVPQLYILAQELSLKLKKQSLCGSTITIKIRYMHRNNVSKSHRLNYKTNLSETIFETTVFLLKALNPKHDVSLLGIAVQNLQYSDNSDESTLLDPEKRKKAALEQALDKINTKFGPGLLKKAAPPRQLNP